MIYDIIIVGAGPAGLTAGANAANRGLKTLILEGLSVAGGQPMQLYPKKLIIDHPGFPKGVTGRELSKRLYEQAIHSKAEIKLNEPVTEMRLSGEPKKIFTSKRTYEGKRVIVATGLHNIPRHLECLRDYTGTNVHYFIKEPRYFAGKRVLIIGGGDTAFDRANMLTQHAKEIVMLVREQYTKAKVSTVEAVEKAGAVVHFSSELMRLNKGDKTAVCLNTKTKKKFNLVVDDVMVSIGFTYSLDTLVKSGLKKDKNGMIKVDERMETSIPGVFAAGDLVGDVKLIAVACSEGIVAAIHTFDSIKKPYWLNK
jgi:ferredoxin/flavodoxin---NADP+ reductase